MDSLSRYRGSLLGLAAGDALGAAVEFMPPGSFEPLTDLRAGGPHRLQRGQWTDDTSMALCLAESLVECRGFDPADQMKRYVRWWRQGYLSSTGRCFDIGNVTASALDRFERTGEPFSGPTEPHTAGNGSLMRLAPVALFFYPQGFTQVGVHAVESSRTTHGALEAEDACHYFSGLLHGALEGEEKTRLLSPRYDPDSPPQPPIWDHKSLMPRIAEIAAGSFKRKQPPLIRGTGYVVESLEAALWAFYRTDTFERGALLAANLGDDADTTAAIYGQLAGAFYGMEAVPPGWRAALTMADRITGLADELHALANPAG